MGNEQRNAGTSAVDWSQQVDLDWHQFDFSAYERQLVINGRKVNYVDLGDEEKPVLFYIHGLMGTWKNWIFNILPFVDRYRVIAIDLPGFGHSDMPNGEFSIERYAATVKQFCGELGIERVTVIGNSMGGQVAAITAKKFPELIEQLFLVDAAGFSTCNRYLRRFAPLAWMITWIFTLGVLLRNVIAGSKFLTTVFLKFVLHKPAAIGSELALMLLEGAGKQGFAPAVKTITTTPIYKFPGNVDVPTVIVWGRNDTLLPKSDAFRYAKLIPHAELEIMDDVGHIPMFETPDRFNALVEHHLVAGSQGAAGAATPIEPAAA